MVPLTLVGVEFRVVGVLGARLDEPESCIRAFVDDLNVFLAQRYVDFGKFDVELKLLFDLGLGDVEFLALEVEASSEAVVPEVFADDAAAVKVLASGRLRVGDERPLLKDHVDEFGGLADVSLCRYRYLV